MAVEANRRRAPLRRLLTAALLTLVLLAGLFLFNGLSPSWRTPDHGTTAAPPLRVLPQRLVVVTYNIAKCFSHRGGLSFREVAEIERCLDDIAKLIRAQKPHLVFLTEINKECGPCPVDQVRILADRTKMHAWAFGENYSWGVPFYRIRSGNALLSRFPLRPLEVQALVGEGPFWRPVGRRRVLWAELLAGDKPLLVASLRNDSFDIENNARQVEQILARIGEREALLGGDFNAPPESKPIERLRSSGKFSARWHGPPTFPAHAPNRCIDFILAPSAWKLVEHRVIASELSDHRPVVSIFERP